LVSKNLNEVKVDLNEVKISMKIWKKIKDLRNFIGPENLWTNHKLSYKLERSAG